MDTYHASKSEWVFLANAYVDLGTWWCMTPFIGAGVGAARVQLRTSPTIASPPTAAASLPGWHSPTTSKWNFAWAAHAGLAYKVNQNFTVELAYRYLDLGDGLTGDRLARPSTARNNIVNPTTFKNITSHDLTLGVRWELDSPAMSTRRRRGAQGLIEPLNS